jgi:anti-sigma factor RsiW
MNCLECRRLTLIDPNDDTAARLTHLESCAGCIAFTNQMLEQDELMREATNVEVPEGFAARILLNQSLHAQSRRPTRWWLSLAASIVIAVVFAPEIVSNVVYQPFEDELVSHVDAHDVLSGKIHEHVTEPGKIRQVLAATGTDMPDYADNILYAATCIIDGEVMAHLLVEDNDEQYVVFLIPQSTVIERGFQHANWSGQLARVNNRTMAVLNRNGDPLETATDALTKQFERTLSSGTTI